MPKIPSTPRNAPSLLTISKSNSKKSSPVISESKETNSNGSLVDCPVCSRKVKESSINAHLDSNCAETYADSAKKVPKSSKVSFQPSLFMFYESDAKTMPSFFKLCWPSDAIPTATFLHAQTSDSSNYTILEQFNWAASGENSKLMLCVDKHCVRTSTDIDLEFQVPLTKYQILERQLSIVFPTCSKYSNLALLKSHLQKCIRRRKSYQAVLSAWHILCLKPAKDVKLLHQTLDNLNQLLRRLAVIMIEDVMMHSHYTILVWLMVYCSRLQSCKQYGAILTTQTWKEIGFWLLSLVYWMAECPYRDPISSEKFLAERQSQIPEMIKNEQVLDASICQSLNQKDLLFSLLIRKSYGGMQCDVDMLQTCAAVWYNRFVGRSKEVLAIEKSPPILPQTSEFRGFYRHFLSSGNLSGELPVMQLSEWVLNSVDYHVSHIATQVLDRLDGSVLNHLGSTQEEQLDSLKDLIWNDSSGVTAKQPVNYNMKVLASDTTKVSKLWKQIEPLFLKQAWQILRLKN